MSDWVEVKLPELIQKLSCLKILSKHSLGVKVSWKSSNKRRQVIVFDYPFEWVSSNILEHDIQETSSQIISLFECVSVLAFCSYVGQCENGQEQF